MITSGLLAETLSCVDSPQACSVSDSYSPGFMNICFDFDNPKANMQFTPYSPVIDDYGLELKWNYSLEVVSYADKWGNIRYDPNFDPDDAHIVLMEADNTLSFNPMSSLPGDTAYYNYSNDGATLSLKLHARTSAGYQAPVYSFTVIMSNCCSGLSYSAESEIDVMFGRNAYLPQAEVVNDSGDSSCDVTSSSFKIVCKIAGGIHSITGDPAYSSLLACPTSAPDGTLSQNWAD
jgi:hypothetical protein